MAEITNNLNFDDELLSAYVDGELTVEERGAVEARLANDSSARELVAEMRTLSGTLRSLPREKVVDDVRAGVLNQLPEKRVTLPPRDISLGRRLLWPMLAIAVALMLMFVQENEKRDVGEVAKVEADRNATPEQPELRDEIAAVDAPATVSAPRASAPVIGAPAGEVGIDTLRATTPAPAEADVAAEDFRLSGKLDEAVANNESGVGIVHLTLADLRTGTEHFNRLLVSNGVQVMEPEAVPPATAVNGNLAFDRVESAEESAPVARTFSAPSASGGAGGYGGVATSNAPPTNLTESQSEPEMVLVEAPREQIEQILFGCSNDTEAIKEVSIDPTANGTIRAPEKQQLSQYHQYERGVSSELKLKGYNVTPSQQGMIAALNSMKPPLEQEGTSSEGMQNQGWATRVREQPADLRQLGVELNNRRNQYLDNARQQSAVPAQQKLAKKEAAASQSMRVLFLLHPSKDAAAKQ